MLFNDWLGREESRSKIDALEKWMQSNPQYANARLHMSNTRKINAKSRGQWIAPGSSRANAKPDGLWYGIGFSWFHFLLFQYYTAIENFIFSVDIIPSFVIFLRNEKQLEEFEAKYCPNAEKSAAWGNFNTFGNSGSSYKKVTSVDSNKNITNITYKNYCIFPDWIKVAHDYDGIELNPDELYPEWAKEWAVNSGCIWNKRSIKAVTPIAAFDVNQGIYV